ncbi:hypothetical protein [Bacillus sp. N6]|uniref:hypothetical protein n=1 Tax=Bacillus sp. N6 TaxID=127893 RepID=UPI00405722BD
MEQLATEGKVESPQDIVPFNMRPRRWMKDELQNEADNINASLHSFILMILADYLNRKK